MTYDNDRQEKIEELVTLLQASADADTENLKSELSKAYNEINDLKAKLINESTKARDSEVWRDKYETVINTPEVKADTESAFNRGHHIARQKMAAWFIDVGQKMMNEEEPTNE